ncbi:MAG: tetratricopeptide repeat protein [Methanobacteriota archaeon]|nr:MAG: tetratricopeptide repeat protein [Euryarchaeota archaeon]
MGGSLTVSERILFHLQGFIKYEEKYEVPFHLTQDGISQSCSISRAHAAIELKKLKSSGLVEERLSHVRKGKTRRKVYLLTHEGKTRASAIVQYVNDNHIDPLVDASKVSPEAVSIRGRRACMSSPMPSLRYFFGRERELAELERALQDPKRRLLVVRGIPGIGKTTLLVKLLSGMSDQRVYWYSIKPWDMPRNVAGSLGAFFSENGDRRLEVYLASGAFEVGEMSFLLKEMLAENGYLFVFDDADVSEGMQEFLLMFRYSSGAGKMVATVEGGARFYDRSEVIAKGEVAELELGGLDTRSALKLLSARGIKEKVGRELVNAVNGHPLSLEMVTEPTPLEARQQLSRFFEERFYDALSEEQRSLLQLASVFQSPFTSDAIPRGLRGVRRGSMLREVAPGRFEIHASIRDFVYGHMTTEELRRWHSVAADHYLRSGDQQERLLHLLKANRKLEAEMLIARLGEDLLDGYNIISLWQELEGFEPSRPRYRPGVMLTRARLAGLMGCYDDAWRILEEVSQDAADELRAEALIEMGLIMSERGTLEEASELLTDALSRTGETTKLRSKALRGLGVVEFRMGEHAKAEELLRRSVQDSLSVMDQKGLLKAHLELGNVLIARGEYEKAIEHYSKCAVGIGPANLSNSYFKMGVACARLDRLAEARSHLENAVRLATDTGQPRTKAKALESLAEVLIKSGDTSAAKERCFEALEVCSELDDCLGVAAAYSNLGRIEKLFGNDASGEEYYAESLRALEGSGVNRATAENKAELGKLLAGQGETDRAAALLEESIEISKSISAADLVSMADAELRKIEDIDGH